MSAEKKIEDGGSAYPSTSACESWQCRKPSSGMTLRDYFAAAALTGFLSNARFDETASFETVAKHAFASADAMITVRKQEL